MAKVDGLNENPIVEVLEYKIKHVLRKLSRVTFRLFLHCSDILYAELLSRTLFNVSHSCRVRIQIHPR